MKKALLIVLALVLVFSVSAFAAKKMVEVDDGTPEEIYENCVSTNVWPWAMAFYNLSYERMLGSAVSIRPRGGYFGLSAGDFHFFTLGVDVFYHPMQKGIAGWFLGPRYDAWIATGNGVSGMMHMIGGMAGYKGVISGGFTWGIALGVQLNIANSVSSGSSSTDISGYTGTIPAFDTEVGWSF
jgi:hypothetical protein